MKKNPFKCMVHDFVYSIDPATREPMEAISTCIYCGYSKSVTELITKVSSVLTPN